MSYVIGLSASARTIHLISDKGWPFADSICFKNRMPVCNKHVMLSFLDRLMAAPARHPSLQNKTLSVAGLLLQHQASQAFFARNDGKEEFPIQHEDRVWNTGKQDHGVVCPC